MSIETVLTIEEMALGGEGVAHHDGMAVFVPLTVPGDRVAASLDVKGRFAKARLLRVIEPSKERVAPDCRLHPACGGCPWIEMAPDAQLRAKAQVLTSTLEHVGRLKLDDVEVRTPVMAPSFTRYRHRARLHAERGENGRVMGFLPMRGRGVIAVQSCPVLEKPLEKILGIVSKILVRAPQGPLDVQMSSEPEAQGGRVGLLLDTLGKPDVKQWQRTMFALHDAGIAAVEVQRKHRTIVASKDLSLRHAIAPHVKGGPFRHDAACFTQGNRAQNESLIRLVLEGLALKGDENVVELHAGCGNFSLPVAQQAKSLITVESFPRAVEWARNNVRQAGMDAKVKAHIADADHVPKVVGMVQGKVDALLLDPPRTGAKGIAEISSKLKPQRIVYVSCNPATLARDVAQLHSHGYILKSVQAVDLFPRTWHVEAVAVLEAA